MLYINGPYRSATLLRSAATRSSAMIRCGTSGSVRSILSPAVQVRLITAYPLSTIGCTADPFTEIDEIPSAFGELVYSALTSRRGSRIRIVKFFAEAGFTTIETFSLHG